MSQEKKEVILVMMFIFNELWQKIEDKKDIPSKPVSKLLKQLRKKINALDEDFYQECRAKIGKAKNDGLEEVVRIRKGKYIASKEELLQSFYDALNKNPYQNVWVRENTVIAAINSLKEIGADKNDLEYINNSRVLIKSFLKHLGVQQDNTLARRKYILEQNMILEGKIA